MLPKLISAEDTSDFADAQEGESTHVDVSVDASDVEADSSMRSLDLPPLEKARRRRLLLAGQA